MRKYQLISPNTLEPCKIIVDEDAIVDFLDLIGWTEEEFKNATIPYEEEELNQNEM